MTQPKLSHRLEEFRLAQQARYAEIEKARRERDLLNVLALRNQPLNNDYLLMKEENK